MTSAIKALVIVTMFLGGVGAGAQSYTPDLLRRAEQGDAKAQFDLGLAYALGRGVARDDVQAVAWYRKAAEQGDAIAQFTLGVAYAQGRGVARDYVQAAAWYRKAAEQGNGRAQTNLGGMYGNGQGVARDDVQAAAGTARPRSRVMLSLNLISVWRTRMVVASCETMPRPLRGIASRRRKALLLPRLNSTQ